MKVRVSNFQKFDLDPHEQEQATQVSPYFWCYLQNKIADYAESALGIKFESDSMSMIIEHERRTAQVEVLLELMQELTPPQEADVPTHSNSPVI